MTLPKTQTKREFPFGSLLASFGALMLFVNGVIGNSIFPGLGTLFSGLLRAASSATDGHADAMGRAANDDQVWERFGFIADPQTGVTWLTFQGEQDMSLAMNYYPANGVEFISQGVTAAGLPALAILSEHHDLALDVSHSFWSTWGDTLANGAAEAASSGANLTADLLNFDF